MTNERPQQAGLWEVDLVRLTGFPMERQPIQPQPWWAEAVGQEPEREVNRPQAQQWQVEGKANFADMADATLSLRVQPARIDWLLRAQTGEAEGPEFLGPMPSVLSTFRETMARSWLVTMQVPLRRLALGIVAMVPVADVEQGNRHLSRLLPFQVDPGAADFQYRINRPAPSASLADRRLINRLQTWSVPQVETVFFDVSEAATGATELTRRGVPFVGCRLELDINTAVGDEGLPQEQLGDLLSEFCDIALDLAERGDRTA